MTNRHKAQVVDALRGTYPLGMLLDVVGLSSSSFYYQLHAMARRDKYCQLRKDIAAIAAELFPYVWVSSYLACIACSWNTSQRESGAQDY